MRYIANKKTNEAEWKRERAKRITGSRASAILGLSKYQTPYSVWLEIRRALGLEEQVETMADLMQLEPEQAEAAFWGNRLEDVVLVETAKKLGVGHEPTSSLFSSEALHEWLAVSPDAFLLDKSGVRQGLMSAKTTSAYIGHEWADGAIPIHAMIQSAVEMGVLDMPVTHIGCLIGGQRLEVRTFERDSRFEDRVFSDLNEFWQVNILGGKPPRLEAADSDFLKDVYRLAKSEAVNVMPVDVELRMEEREKLSAQIKMLEDKKERINAQIKLAIGDAYGIEGSEWRATWANTEGRFDSNRFKAEHPGLYAAYKKDEGSRTLRVTRTKGAK